MQACAAQALADELRTSDFVVAKVDRRERRRNAPAPFITSKLQQEAAKQHEAVVASEQALQLMMNQYKVGSVGYLDVVVTQSTALMNERMAVDLDRRQMAASVMLVKALGGTWRNTTAE